MEYQEILLNLFKNKHSNVILKYKYYGKRKEEVSEIIQGSWIHQVEDKDINVVSINRFLSMNPDTRLIARWLDKYTFKLSPKMYLSLAWSAIEKKSRVPYIPFFNNIEKNKYDFILKKVKKQYRLSDNDFNAVKNIIVKDIEKDPVPWFRYYGIRKENWKIHLLSYNLMRDKKIEAW